MDLSKKVQKLLKAMSLAEDWYIAYIKEKNPELRQLAFKKYKEYSQKRYELAKKYAQKP